VDILKTAVWIGPTGGMPPQSAGYSRRPSRRRVSRTSTRTASETPWSAWVKRFALPQRRSRHGAKTSATRTFWRLHELRRR